MQNGNLMGIRNIRSQDYLFIPWNFRSREFSFPRTNKPCRPSLDYDHSDTKLIVYVK